MPKRVSAWEDLARSYAAKGDVDEALSAYRKVVELKPEASFAVGLNVLNRTGRREEAILHFRKAIELDKDHTEAHYSIGTNLHNLGRSEEAIPYFLRTLKLKSDHAQAWCNLGWCYRGLGRWSEALEPLRKGHKLGSQRKNWGYRSALWVQRTERMAALEPKLEIVLKGGAIDATPDDLAILGNMLRIRGRADLAVGLFERAFAEDPKLEIEGKDHQYRAIHAAVVAGGEHRKQALVWLRAWQERLRPDLADRPMRVSRQILLWQRKTELVPVRDGDSVPEEWKKFWENANALQKQAEAAVK